MTRHHPHTTTGLHMTRRDWSEWTISPAPPRPIHDHPDGLMEPRSFVKCPMCLEKINVAAATAMSNRSLTGRHHLKKCPGQPLTGEPASTPMGTVIEDGVVLPPSKRPRGDVTGEPKKRRVTADIVTIYALVYIPTGKRVYTGRTKDPDRRLGQHASKGSKCRLVKNAFRKHGRKSFALEPIMRCRKPVACR